MNLKSVIELNSKVNQINQEAYDSIKKVSDLTLPQAMVLSYVNDKYPIKMIEVSKGLQFTGANLTCITDNLERKGLIQRKRSLKDRRAILLLPTEKGINVINAIENIDSTTEVQ